MVNKRKNSKLKVFLIPTTESVLKGWLEHYKYIINDSEIDLRIIIDSDLINSMPTLNNIKVETSIQHCIMKQDNFIWKVLNVLVNKRNILFYLKKETPDLIIVSNDIAFPQVLYVNMAKKLGIKTILHQHAGIMYPKDSADYSLLKKIFHSFLGLSKSIVLGSNVDEAWLMGNRWKNYINNKKIKIVGSCFYKEFKNRKRNYNINPKELFLQKHNFNKDSKLICFYSQPLYENGLLPLNIAEKFYTDLAILGKLLKKYNICFIIKQHPQEKLIENTLAKNYLDDESDLDIWIDAPDYSMSAYSQMLLQAKVNGNKTIGFMPEYIPMPQRTQMIEACDFILKKVESIDILINELENRIDNKNKIEEIIKTNINCLEIKNLILEDSKD